MVLRKKDRMGCDQPILEQAQVRVHAGPAVLLRKCDHGRAHGIELDIAIDGHQVALAIDQTRLEAPLPERAGAAVALVEGLDVALPEVSHRTR